MPDILSVNTVAFTVLDYPLSYVELAGTVFYLWSVWLIARRHMLTWPVGISSSLLYMALFYQIRLYSDTIEQVYYLFAGVYGWWYWRAARRAADERVAVRFSRVRAIAAWAVATLALSCVAGAAMSRAHLWLPALFPEPASYPYLDALTTIMSFVAMWLMARKRVESWVYWIIVDVIGIGLYYAKDVHFVALLYVILLVMAVAGLRAWLKSTSVLTDRRGIHRRDAGSAEVFN
jgi:nicotinamide mononucleotide transporter